MLEFFAEDFLVAYNNLMMAELVAGNCVLTGHRPPNSSWSTIEQDLRHAAQQKADVERLSAQLTQRLAAIDEEARAKIQQAVLEGRRIGMEIQEDARAQAQGILAKSRETIELELAKAKVSLRDEMADMAMETVERLLKHKLDPEADRRLVAGILDELGEPGRSRG